MWQLGQAADTASRSRLISVAQPTSLLGYEPWTPFWLTFLKQPLAVVHGGRPYVVDGEVGLGGLVVVGVDDRDRPSGRAEAGQRVRGLDLRRAETGRSAARVGTVVVPERQGVAVRSTQGDRGVAAQRHGLQRALHQALGTGAAAQGEHPAQEQQDSEGDDAATT
jgi:hypothetical protein